MLNRDDHAASVLERARRLVAENNASAEAAFPPPRTAPTGDDTTPLAPLDEQEMSESVQAPVPPGAPPRVEADPVERVHNLRRSVVERVAVAPEPRQRREPPSLPRPRFGGGLDPLTAGAALVAIAVIGLAAAGLVVRNSRSSHSSSPLQAVQVAATVDAPSATPAPTPQATPTVAAQPRPTVRVAIAPQPSPLPSPTAAPALAAAVRPSATPPVTRPAIVATFGPSQQSAPPPAATQQAAGASQPAPSASLASIVASASQAPPPAAAPAAPASASSGLSASAAPAPAAVAPASRSGSAASSAAAAPVAAAPVAAAPAAQAPAHPLAPKLDDVASQANRAAAAAAAVANRGQH